MAKTYSRIVADSMATQYADISTTGATIVPVANRAFAKALSARANFIPGPGPSKGKFEIQRRKRTKRHAADVNANHGTRIVNRLNAAEKIDWETVTIVPGVKYDFLVNIEPGDAANFANDPGQFTDQIDTASVNGIISNEEEAIEAILADATVRKISLGDLSASDLETWGEKLFDKLSLEKTNVKQFVDDYKHMSQATMHIGIRAADALKAFKGTVFNVDSSRYADDIVPNFTFTNSDTGLVNAHFDKFTVDQAANGGVAGERILAIILDDEAYFDSGNMNNVHELNTKILDETFIGHSYFGARGVVDAKRIVVITGKIDTDVVVKVND